MSSLEVEHNIMRVRSLTMNPRTFCVEVKLSSLIGFSGHWLPREIGAANQFHVASGSTTL